MARQALGGSTWGFCLCMVHVHGPRASSLASLVFFFSSKVLRQPASTLSSPIKPYHTSRSHREISIRLHIVIQVALRSSCEPILFDFAELVSSDGKRRPRAYVRPILHSIPLWPAGTEQPPNSSHSFCAVKSAGIRQL